MVHEDFKPAIATDGTGQVLKFVVYWLVSARGG